MTTSAHGKRHKKTGKQRAKSAAKVNRHVNKKKGARPVGGSVQNCPGEASKAKKTNTNVICDIASLTLKDETSKKNLTCSSHDESPLSREIPRRIANHLGHYDLVMELMSDYELVTSLEDMDTEVDDETNKSEEKKKFVKLHISRTGKGNCPNREHPSVKMIPSSSLDSRHEHDWKTKPPEVVQIPARPMSPGDRALAWIIPFWNFGKGPMDLDVIAEGCGVGVDSPVNYQLKGLVRIYTNDKYELTLSLPPFKSWSKEKERLHWKDKEMDSGSTSSTTFGKKTSENKYEREKDGDEAATWSSTKGKTVGDHYESTETKYKDGKLTKEPSRTDYSAGGLLSTTYKGEDDVIGTVGTSLKLTLKHNGSPMNTVKKLEGIIRTVFDIEKAISRIKKLLDTVPKIGLTYKLEASILQGSLKGTWGNRFMEGARGAGPRHIAVESYFDIDVQLKLFDASFELGFGFQLTIPAILDWFDDPTLELILKAAIKASAELAIKYKALSSGKDNHKVKVEAEPGLTVYLECKVNAFGKGLDADAGVRGGIKAEGSFHVSFEHAPDFELDVGSKPIEVYARFFIDVVVYDKSAHWEKELVPAHKFYKGPIPHKDATPGEAKAAGAGE